MYPIHKLSFGTKDGALIKNVELSKGKPYGPDFIVDDSEEIIGVFGTREGYVIA